MSKTDPQIATARAALARGDWPAVARAAQMVGDAAPQRAEALFLLGLAEAGQGRISAATALLRQAVARDPQGEYRAQLARLLIMTRQDSAAAQALAEAEHALPDDALSRDTMGCVYARLGDHAASLPHFAHAVAQAPDILEYRYNHAAALNFVGQVSEAEAALEALIARAPGHGRAHHLLASLKRHTADSHHVPRLRAQLDAAHDPRDRLLLGYALAKELDDLGEHDAAFTALAAANAEHRARLPYRFASDAANFDAIEAAWPALAHATVTGAPTEAPIFVIGMPRTGTTLVDRILSSHPEVESAGELQAMPLAVKHAAGTRTRTVLDPETIAALREADLGAIGHDYLARARHHRRDTTRRFVDKFPGNFHYAGIVAGSLPNARIICLRRHPMDTVLSNFRNLFAITSRYYDYSYDLMDIARYYARFDRLMRFWQAAMPGRILEVSYEDLVADQEGVTRRMLDHAGLPWDAACLDFHRNQAPVSTPSAAQVRRPIYRDALARWKRHEDALGEVAAFFAEQGIAID
ncbi:MULTISPECIES: sulfotransferase [unclassified Novosphingobium]|uniref:tetratricopeptide repeat-containing sulfotransferase family protein n=1 Tax=unclassified Novosphingobium TaxID=2644732 RepID=UPI00149410A2|nr:MULTISPECIES: sulfotransferase [unclassified Novosphingobium]MBB3357879.1 tetratricopeptide (TPR) repeat protein [Novosphingobium sp. BK256]MBB3374240.1 tetratricopeptide (TPR) repeat protein [Novosphingobium sp. BK280]MBB3378652.1 tetratricopeptide (TPR) repeat protein [Novosphingobium sp. BK258]MBB3420346.1 tetratricopeptide (TPR) repeat protein [Novosphingobium sp. BK267]MBB3448532.1 tetratricopeptide (TPR) repeat protein [Novosphingobium sp. BK352]